MATIPCVTFGIIFSRFLLELGTTSTVTAWIFNLGLSFSGTFSYFTGPLVKEFGWRRVSFVSTLVLGLGFITSAFATSAWFLFFSFSIIVGKCCPVCLYKYKQNMLTEILKLIMRKHSH